MEGWIKLHRKILNHEIWADVTAFRLFMLLLLNSAYQEFEYHGIQLKPGQYIRSYSNLAKDLSYREKRGYKSVSKKAVFNAVKKLLKNNMISVKETEIGTLFTVLNYQYYQEFSEFEEVNGKHLRKRNGNDTETIWKQEKEIKEIKNIYIPVLEYLNEQTKTNFRATSKKTQSLINARVREGFTIDDFKKVIDVKVQQWLNDEKMKKYLRPETLFGTKFESYLNEYKQNTSVTKSRQTISDFNFDLTRGE